MSKTKFAVIRIDFNLSIGFDNRGAAHPHVSFRDAFVISLEENITRALELRDSIDSFRPVRWNKGRTLIVPIDTSNRRPKRKLRASVQSVNSSRFDRWGTA